MIKVLIVHSTNNIISGAEYAINDMLTEIPENIEIEMQTPGYGPLTEFYQRLGFKVHSRKFAGVRRKYPGLYLLTSRVYSNWLKKNGFDIVLCNTFGASFRVSLATELSKKKLIIYTREYFSKQKKINYKQIERAAEIFAVSKDVKNYFGNIHPNVEVCYDTIDIDLLLKRIKNHDQKILDSKSQNVGFVGRITTYKQPDLFLKSIPIVLKELPDTRFHVVGSATDQEKDFENSLIRLAAELGISDKVKFWGRRNDAVELISELDVFCMTSDREPFPRTIIEASLAKTAVICSNTGGCPEMVEDRKTGLYFDVNSAENHLDLAEKMIRLLNNNEEREMIIENAYSSAIESFGGKKQVKHFFERIVKVAESE